MFKQARFLLTITTTSSDCCIINAFYRWSCSLRNRHVEIEGSELADKSH
jgi:hypothetical protein